MGSEVKKDYSLSLLSLATERLVITGSPLAFSEGGIKERVKNVLNFKKWSRVTIILAIIFAMVLCVGFAGNRIGGVNTFQPAFPVYSVNESGQTYGSASEAFSVETLPTLIYAGSVDNIGGYIYTKDLLNAMPKTTEEAQDFIEKWMDLPLYKEDGKTIIGDIGYCAGLLPESIRNEYVAPIYPVNENGQTYGMNIPDLYLQSPDLIAAIGIDGTAGYVYQTDLDEEQPNNPDEAVEYMKKLNERKEEMKITGDEYVRTIPLYTEDGVTVIGEFGIGSEPVIQIESIEMGTPYDFSGMSESEIELRKKEDFHKAMEGDLENRLLYFEAIDNAEVMLNIADNDPLFTGQTSASVILTTSKILGEEEAVAIATIISRSVQNLDIENVKIADQNGNILYPVISK